MISFSISSCLFSCNIILVWFKLIEESILSNVNFRLVSISFSYVKTVAMITVSSAKRRWNSCQPSTQVAFSSKFSILNMFSKAIINSFGEMVLSCHMPCWITIFWVARLHRFLFRVLLLSICPSRDYSICSLFWHCQLLWV